MNQRATLGLAQLVSAVRALVEHDSDIVGDAGALQALDHLVPWIMAGTADASAWHRREDLHSASHISMV